MLAVAFDGPTALVALKQVLGVPERSGRADTEHAPNVPKGVTLPAFEDTLRPQD
jgi:hypothetical protein